jgi:Xaa-Pro aminopeptidase
MIINESIVDDLGVRWGKIQNEMRVNGYDACLLTISVNLYYVTGKIFNGYFYLPVEGKPLFFVKRPSGLTGDGVFYVRKPEQILDCFKELSLPAPESLLLEGDELTYNEAVRLQSIFSPKRVGNATALMRKLRMIKTNVELDLFRKSAKLHTLTYGEIAHCYRSGMTDLEFQYEIEALSRRNGSIGLFRAFGTNMDIFMGSILTGDNAGAASPYDFALGGSGMDDSCPIGANGTLLTEGMAVMVDVAGNYTPYISDLTRTFSVGKLTELAYRAHKVSIDIVRAIEAKAAIGFPVADIYNLALDIVKGEGLSDYFMGTKQQAKFVGHGIGLQINELPVFTPRSKDVLTENMVFALEPKFVIPGVGAVGIENSYIMTSGGPENITPVEEEIIELS